MREVEDRDMLLLSCGTRKNVIRWIPPLISTAADIDEGLSKFADALAATGGGAR
jgi:4-aminobutyrate aminotransferase